MKAVANVNFCIFQVNVRVAIVSTFAYKRSFTNEMRLISELYQREIVYVVCLFNQSKGTGGWSFLKLTMDRRRGNTLDMLSFTEKHTYTLGSG